MNLRSMPFLKIILPFATGIAIGGMYEWPIPYSTPLLTGMLLITFFLTGLIYPKRYNWIFGLWTQIVFFTFGYYHVVAHNEKTQDAHFSAALDAGFNPTYIKGLVYEAPSFGGKRVKVPVRLEAIGDQDTLMACTGNTLLFVESDSLSHTLHYGDVVLVETRLRPTEGPKNPHAFDYGRYLHFQNIHYQAFVSSDALRVLDTGKGNAVWRMAYGCRDRLLELLQKHFTTKDEYAVASALLVGYKDDLSDDLRTSYAETGSMHALAVSGTHVGLLYVGLMFLLGRLPFRGRKGRLLELGIIFVAIWGFAFLTGATASVLRATVMFSIYLLGQALFRQASVWNVLASSAFLLLFYNPYFLFDAGFQLSYAAVAGMVFFYPLFYKASPIIPYKWLDEGWKVLLIGFAAQIGTLPLSLYYFHQFPVYFWLAGWVVVLGGAIFLWGGAILILVDAIAPSIAYYIGQLLYWMLWGMNQLIILIQGLPGSVISGIWLTAGGVVLLYFVIVSLGTASVIRQTKWTLAGLGGLACLLSMHAFRYAEQDKQAYLIIYSIPKTSLIDFCDGHSSYHLKDSLLTAKQEKFAAQSNRWSKGIEQNTPLSFEQSYTNPNVWWHPPVLAVKGLRVAIVEDKESLENMAMPIEVDILILRNNAKWTIPECVQWFPCKRIVFDASNNRKSIQAWTTACVQMGIEYHDVSSQGAYEQLIN